MSEKPSAAANWKDQLRIDIREHAVRTFIASKHAKLPDLNELRAWLLEFSDEAWRIAESWQKSAEEQVRLSARPIIMASGSQPAAPPQTRNEVIDELISELIRPDFTLHKDDGEITYYAIGEWLAAKRVGLAAAPHKQETTNG